MRSELRQFLRHLPRTGQLQLPVSISFCASTVVSLIVAALILVGEAAQSHVSGVEHVLDLVAHRSSDDATLPTDPLEIPSGIVGGVGHSQAAAEQNIQITLFSISPLLQRAGDPFVYEVIVENVGRKSVRIPWSPEQNLFSRRMRDARTATVSLSTASASPQLIANVTLYGAEAVAGSLLDLAPGDKARIRAPGVWALPADAAVPALRMGSIRVVAIVTIYAESGVVGPVRSHNQVELGVQ
jgi:hypothetical protein